MRTETKWAVIAAIVVFVWLFIGKLLGLQTEENLSTAFMIDMIVSIVIFVVVYYMVTREKRDRDLNGIMSWTQGFWAAAIMTLIFIPISTLLIYIFAKSVNPDFVRLIAEQAGQGSIDLEPVNYFLKAHIQSAIFGGLFFSLLFPLFTRRSEG